MDPKAQVRESYNRIAAAYLLSRCRDSPDVALLDDLVVRLPPRARVLDAGCGAGVPIAQQLAIRVNVVGVDFAEVQLGLARRNVPAGSWVCADLVALPFADASFDAVCSYYAVIHIPREQHAEVFDGFARVLRSGGLALLCLGAADLPTWTEEYHDAPMYWSHYDAETNLALVEAAGFELVWHRWVIDGYVADGSVGHLFVLAQRTGRAGLKMDKEPLPAAGKVRSLIDRLITDGAMISERDGSTHDVRTVAISAGEGEAHTRWVLREHATKTIEIGLAYGVSTLCICEGLIRSADPGARHVVLDPFQAGRFANYGLQVLKEAGVDFLVEYHDEMSQIILPAFLKEKREFDLAFVDGNHRFDSVFIDLFYLGRLLRRGGVVILDDYNLPGIQRAVSFFLANLGWRVEEESSTDDDHHWVVLRTAETADNRHFRYFVDF